MRPEAGQPLARFTSPRVAVCGFKAATLFGTTPPCTSALGLKYSSRDRTASLDGVCKLFASALGLLFDPRRILSKLFDW
ncbi:hypothetical protein PIIN_10113 [Serendipita indica DSM 11827]|uniref:Uncharacterized protein n=1 Tax=Serendipita indica (strain DSM 11827) TaxID=1109443 RepID=G4TXS0_SERID|nr:hypothetical protein PIIN_10113 [Serendipita indica DSM 11827]